MESDFRQTKHKLSKIVKSSWLNFLELEWNCILKHKLKYQALVLVRYIGKDLHIGSYNSMAKRTTTLING